MNGTESALFVNALGKPQLFSLPALRATDFVLLLFRQVCSEGGKLPGFHKAPLNDDPRQASYYTDYDQYFNQLFAAIYDQPQEGSF